MQLVIVTRLAMLEDGTPRVMSAYEMVNKMLSCNNNNFFTNINISTSTIATHTLSDLTNTVPKALDH